MGGWGGVTSGREQAAHLSRHASIILSHGDCRNTTVAASRERRPTRGTTGGGDSQTPSPCRRVSQGECKPGVRGRTHALRRRKTRQPGERGASPMRACRASPPPGLISSGAVLAGPYRCGLLMHGFSAVCTHPESRAPPYRRRISASHQRRTMTTGNISRYGTVRICMFSRSARETAYSVSFHFHDLQP